MDQKRAGTHMALIRLLSRVSARFIGAASGSATRALRLISANSIGPDRRPFPRRSVLIRRPPSPPDEILSRSSAHSHLSVIHIITPQNSKSSVSVCHCLADCPHYPN
uniref:Secreted protein n=1 Tax=Steinernema glaseri TaxID=37863 RepID=A0A1I7YUU3_9BILA